MKCCRCRETIDLVTKKDPDTKMYYNKWWCKTCDEEAFPSLPSHDDIRFGNTAGGFKELVMDEEVEALEVEEAEIRKPNISASTESKKITDAIKDIKIQADALSKGFRQGLIDSHQQAKTFPKESAASIPETSYKIEYVYKKAKRISGVGIIDKDGRAKIVTQKKSGKV